MIYKSVPTYEEATKFKSRGAATKAMRVMADAAPLGFQPQVFPGMDNDYIVSINFPPELMGYLAKP